MSDMPIRIMQFEFHQDELKQSLPVLFFELGFSMTLPYLEPYLIRTMRESLKQTTNQPQPAKLSAASRAARAIRPRGVTALVALLGSVLSTYLPWYNPANIKLPPKIAELSTRYSSDALETRFPQ